MTVIKLKKLNSVLLIDDNEIDNFINRAMLENCGVTNIVIFESAITALQYLDQTTDIPQLILLDINFPIMDGFEFLNRFRKLAIAQHHIDIYILSASSNPIDIKKAHQKCCGFIEKCLSKEKLISQLDSFDLLNIDKSCSDTRTIGL